MKLSLILTFVLFTFSLSAQYYIEPCKFGQPLVQALQNAYTPNQTLGYNKARDTLYSQIDNNGLNLSGIYSNFTVTLDPNVDPSISAYQGGSGINAEHVYPQSKGASSEPAKSDLFNIYPCRAAVNSSRGSCPFGEIIDSDAEKWFYLSNVLTSIPSSNIDWYSEKDDEDCVFEPRESVKGDIARCVFYFYTIYQSTANNADPNFFNSQKNTLLQWHKNDPVTPQEIRRDSLIAWYQGNHNPFVLDSTLAERAYFMANASYSPGDTGCIDVVSAVVEVEKENWVKVQSNVVTTQLTIQSKDNEGMIWLYDINGRLHLQEPLQTEMQINISSLNTGVYFLKIQGNRRQKVLSILVMK